MTPTWILDILAALMLVVAAVSAARLGLARPWRKGTVVTDADVSHLFMGIAMAGMLASGLTTLPDRAWEVIFALLAVWFGYRVVSDARSNGARALAGGHCAPHLVHSAAMLYLFAALAAPSAAGSGTSMPSMPGMPGMAGGTPGGTPTLHAPTLALILALLLIAFTVHDMDRRAGVDGNFHAAGRPLAPAGPALAAAAARLLLSPAVAKGCQVATGITMAFILIIMV